MKRKFFVYGMVLASFWMVTVFPAAAEEINLVGTENGEPVFRAVAEAFEKRNPGVTVQIPESIDSGGGIKAVADGEARIARVARDFEAHEKGYGLTFVPFGTVQIVFFVNKGVGVENLTAKQLADIYSGAVEDWAAVGGPAGKIRVVTREDGDSALETLEDTLPEFDDIEITSRSKTVFTEVDALKTVETREGTIGFGSYGYAENADVTILSIDGKTPQDEGYPSAHPVGLVFKEENRQGIIQTFIEFATSPAAVEAIQGAGAAPYSGTVAD